MKWQEVTGPCGESSVRGSGWSSHGQLPWGDAGSKDDFLKPWTFTSNDKRFEMKFTPIIDRKSKTDALIYNFTVELTVELLCFKCTLPDKILLFLILFL